MSSAQVFGRLANTASTVANERSSEVRRAYDKDEAHLAAAKAHDRAENMHSQAAKEYSSQGKTEAAAYHSGLASEHKAKAQKHYENTSLFDE